MTVSDSYLPLGLGKCTAKLDVRKKKQNEIKSRVKEQITA